MPEIEAVLTCEDCGDVAEVLRVPADNDGIYEHKVNNLGTCRHGFAIAKCPSVHRKVEDDG